MAVKLSSDNLIAERYASALYDLSLEAKCVDEVLSDISVIQEYINQNNDFSLLIRSPLITSNEKLKIIEKILVKHSSSNLTFAFIKIISNNRRFRNLSSIISRYITINAEKRGDIIADVT